MPRKPSENLRSKDPRDRGKSVCDFVKELEEQTEPMFAPHVVMGDRNRRWVDGDQFNRIEGNELQGIPYYEKTRNRINLNKLRSGIQFWSSRVLDEMPDVWVWAHESGDAGKVRVANALLAYFHEQNQLHAKNHMAANNAQLDGQAIYKCYWDPDEGPLSAGFYSPTVITDPVTGEEFEDVERDEDGTPIIVGEGEPEGDVRLAIVALRNILHDGSEEIQDSPWVIERKMVSPDVARVMLKDAGYDYQDINEGDQEYTDAWGNARRGVMLREFWHVPTPRIPRGVMAVLIGDKVVVNRAFPYRNRKHPFFQWKIFPHDGTFFGGTHVNDAVNIQMQINALKALVTNRARKGDLAKLLAAKEIVARFSASDLGLIPLEDPAVAQFAKWLEGPGLPKGAREEIEALKAEMDAIFNVPAITQGQGIGSSTAARTIAFANRLAAMVLAQASIELQKCLREVSIMALELWQEKVTAPRTVEILGDDDAPIVEEFMGEDLIGFKIKVEPSSGVLQLQANQAEANQQGLAQGAIPPDRDEIAQTGLSETAFESAQATQVLEYVEQLKRGEMVQPDPNINPSVAVTVLEAAISREPNAPHAEDLFNLLRWYRSQNTGAPQPQKALQPSPSGPGAQPATGPGGIPVQV